ncbi:MAG: ATP-binding protein [Spartobacteria bacterium]|nr:ATP-binding protein [Spartobacteria bacterium]
MYKERSLSKKLLRLAEYFPVVVICGARQVGKSTLLKHLFPDYDMVVFDPVLDVGQARDEPDLFLANHGSKLVLDEIQYAPELVAAIKRQVDTDRRPGRFILTGSQQWSVMKSMAESLAGRAAFVDLEGFSLAEIAQATSEESWLHRWLSDPKVFVKEAGADVASSRSLYEQLWRGWLPECDQLPLDVIPSYFEGYLRTYIERDVRLLASVDDWQQFGRFVQLAAALNAQEVNHSKFGRDIGVTPQTAQRWLGLLKATFQWFEIPAFSGNASKRISGKAKGYFGDTGLACYLQQMSSPRTLEGHPQTGALFESAVVAEIRKMAALESSCPKLYHWRSHGGAEVDLLLERDAVYYPVEVKLTMSPRRRDTRGITQFRQTYPHLNIAPGLVVTPGLVSGAGIEKVSTDDYARAWM